MLPATAEELGDNYRGARGQAHKEADNQVNQVAGGAAHRRQGFLAHKVTYHHRVHGIVQLLEQQPHRHGNGKLEQLLPYNALCHIRGAPG